MNKLKIGIDINEVLRARWLQFDRFYAQEFGEEGCPVEQPYVYDFFKYYKWEDTVEINKDLKEPEDMPEDINPLDYQLDEKLGEAPADFAIFKAPIETTLTAKQVYNRFMYEDFVFELFASAPIMYKDMDLHINRFHEKYKNTVDFIIVSKENSFSIPSTLFFLSKMRCRFKNYRFAETNEEMWEGLDILITADPELLVDVPIGKSTIKVIRPFNDDIASNFEIMQVNDLNSVNTDDKIVDVKFNKNEEFEKIINYIKPE